MRAQENFDIKLNVDGEDLLCKARVLYWWEEQDAKTDSVTEDTINQKMTYDQSKVYSKTVDKFLISITTKERKVNRDDLLEMSLKENKNIEWHDILHYRIIVPLYNAYLEMSGSSVGEIKKFRKKVMASFNHSLRTDGLDDFPPPTELIEYKFLKNNGITTRQDLYNMSYSEMLHLSSIREIEKEYMQNYIDDKKENVDPNLASVPKGVYGGEPSEIAKKYFPDQTIGSR